jgi:hypothetical protein
MAENFADWKAICETKFRYCRCLDTKDWAGYTDCFTEDFVHILPPNDSVTHGRDLAVANVRSLVETSVTNHHVHNPEITFDGPDAADVIWALQDRNIWTADRAAAMGIAGQLGFGHYHERYVRCPDGKWRIKQQKLSYVHFEPWTPERG